MRRTKEIIRKRRTDGEQSDCCVRENLAFVRARRAKIINGTSMSCVAYQVTVHAITARCGVQKEPETGHLVVSSARPAKYGSPVSRLEPVIASIAVVAPESPKGTHVHQSVSHRLPTATTHLHIPTRKNAERVTLRFPLVRRKDDNTQIVCTFRRFVFRPHIKKILRIT